MGNIAGTVPAEEKFRKISKNLYIPDNRKGMGIKLWKTKDTQETGTL